jgi:hypothetical protein
MLRCSEEKVDSRQLKVERELQNARRKSNAEAQRARRCAEIDEVDSRPLKVEKESEAEIRRL